MSYKPLCDKEDYKRILNNQEKLKTLKDLARFGVTYPEGNNVEHRTLLDYDEAREEAIKWIKEISKGGFDTNLKIEMLPQTPEDIAANVTRGIAQQETDIVVRFIKHFFNITEEEVSND